MGCLAPLQHATRITFLRTQIWPLSWCLNSWSCRTKVTPYSTLNPDPFISTAFLSSASTARYSITSTGDTFTPPKLQEEEEIEEVELLEDEEEDGERGATESSPSPVLSVRKRRPSSASISSASKLPRYSSSPPLLVPEVEDSVGRVDSPLVRLGWMV